jgi:hypothetical protein
LGIDDLGFEITTFPLGRFGRFRRFEPCGKQVFQRFEMFQKFKPIEPFKLIKPIKLH